MQLSYGLQRRGPISEMPVNRVVNADLTRRFRAPNGEMQVPTFHIGLFAKTSFCIFQFGPDGYSRFWYAVAILGHFDSLVEHSAREKRGGARGGRSSAPLDHYSNPFKNASRKGSPPCSLTKRHRPRWSLVCWVFCLCGCPTSPSRARIRKVFSPFPATRLTTLLF
jgi:hypothetical protein